GRIRQRQQRLGNIEAKAKARSHAYFQNGQVGAREVHVLAERGAFMLQSSQGGSQVGDKIRQHGPAALGCRAINPLQVGERIEQKMRLDIFARGLQSGLGDLQLELNALELVVVGEGSSKLSPSTVCE